MNKRARDLIADLNNQAVECLSGNDLRQAVHHMNKAMALTKRVLNHNDEELALNESSTSYQSQVTDDCPRVSKSTSRRISLIPCSKSGNQEKAILSVSRAEPFMYELPIVISTEANETNPNFFDEAAAIITFNLALTQHRNALKRDGEDRTMRLEKALKLYELCNALRIKEKVSWDYSITMGLFNNIGLITRELGDIEKSRRYFDRMLSAIVMFQVKQVEPSCDGVVWESFIQNAASSVLTDHHFAAAA